MFGVILSETLTLLVARGQFDPLTLIDESLSKWAYAISSILLLC